MSVRDLKKRADTIFSRYIRLKNADYRGYVRCITCGVVKHWKDGMQAGHFQSISHNSTRYHDQNVNPQCVGCNIFKQGEQYKHGKAIDLKYGKGTAGKLERLAKKSKQFTSEELEKMIKKYRKQVKKMEIL